MNLDSVNRAVSNAVNQVREAKAKATPASTAAPAPAPASAPATSSAKSQVQSSFESAAKPQPVNLTGEGAPPTQTAQAPAATYRYVPGSTGLATTGPTAAASRTSEIAGPGTSHSQSIESNRGVGVGFKFETSTSSVMTEPGDNGPEGSVKLQIKGSVYAFVGDEVSGKGVTVEGRLIKGASSTYEIEYTEEQYNEWVRNGSDPSKLPSPYDPESLPPGATVTLKSEHFDSLELGAAYRFIQAQTGNTESRGTAMAVERLDPAEPPRVRVSTGPTEAVQSSVGVGIGTSDFNVSLTGERGLESYNLQTATIDLSTPEGRAAYNNFLLTGQVPQEKGPGVESTAREYKLSYAEALKAGLVAGDHEFSLNLGGTEQEVTITETDTERTVETSFVSTGSAGMASTRSQSYYRDDTGQWAPHPDGSTQVALKNVSTEEAALLQEVFTGQPAGPAPRGSHHAQFTLSDDQAMMLAQRARRYSQDVPLGNSADSLFIRELAEARTPQEVQHAFNASRSNTATIQALYLLYHHAETPMPLGSGYQQVTP